MDYVHKEANSVDNRPREKNIDFLDGGEDGELNDIGLLQIPKNICDAGRISDGISPMME